MSAFYKKKTPEGMLTKSIRDLLRTLGIFHWKQYQTLGSPLGIADILGIYQGKMLAIECKAPRGKLSPHQERFLEIIREQGGIGILAYSVEDVIKGLKIQDRFLNFRR